MAYASKFSLQSLFFLECNYSVHALPQRLTYQLPAFQPDQIHDLGQRDFDKPRIFPKPVHKIWKRFAIHTNPPYGLGTLFWAMNFTKTMMGRRMLIDWMKKPLANKEFGRHLG